MCLTNSQKDLKNRKGDDPFFSENESEYFFSPYDEIRDAIPGLRSLVRRDEG